MSGILYWGSMWDVFTSQMFDMYALCPRGLKQHLWHPSKKCLAVYFLFDVSIQEQHKHLTYIKIKCLLSPSITTTTNIITSHHHHHNVTMIITTATTISSIILFSIFMKTWSICWVSLESPEIPFLGKLTLFKFNFSPLARFNNSTEGKENIILSKNCIRKVSLMHQNIFSFVRSKHVLHFMFGLVNSASISP